MSPALSFGYANSKSGREVSADESEIQEQDNTAREAARRSL